MSKLLQDPKIKMYVEREVAKAVKEERKRCLGVMKALTSELKDATSAVRYPAANVTNISEVS